MTIYLDTYLKRSYRLDATHCRIRYPALSVSMNVAYVDTFGMFASASRSSSCQICQREGQSHYSAAAG